MSEKTFQIRVFAICWLALTRVKAALISDGATQKEASFGALVDKLCRGDAQTIRDVSREYTSILSGK
jgi:hypothetical protein